MAPASERHDRCSRTSTRGSSTNERRRPRDALSHAWPQSPSSPAPAGLIGSESVAPLRRAGLRRRRHRERHARALLRARGLDARAPTQRLRDEPDDVRRGRTRHPRRRRRRRRLFAEHGPDLELVIHAAAQPSHDWAASRPARRTSRVNANGTLNLLEATRDEQPEATFIFTLDQQGLRRHGRTSCRSRSSSTRLELPDGSRLLRRHPDLDVDRPLHALAVRRLQGRRRPDGPGVRALLRHADGLLPRRLPDGPAATPARSCTASSPT